MYPFECGGRWWFVGQQVTARGFLLHGQVLSCPFGDWMNIRLPGGTLQTIHVSIVEPAP